MLDDKVDWDANTAVRAKAAVLMRAMLLLVGCVPNEVTSVNPEEDMAKK